MIPNLYEFWYGLPGESFDVLAYSMAEAWEIARAQTDPDYLDDLASVDELLSTPNSFT